MAQGTCTADGCTNVTRLVRGWCTNCYAWSRSHGWQDPSGRPTKQKAPADGQCTVIEGGVKCSALYFAEGTCEKHHARVSRHGDPFTLRALRGDTLQALLQAAVAAETDDCITHPFRTGHWTVNTVTGSMAASRWVWILRYGDPGAAHILHSCNGGSGANGCVNTRHLRKGDNSENMLDRGDAGVQVGEDHHSSVLTEDRVRAIRERAATGESRAALAAEYGVSRSTVNDVAARRSWRRLQ